MDSQSIPTQQQPPEPISPQPRSFPLIPLIIAGVVILIIGIISGFYLAKKQPTSPSGTNIIPTTIQVIPLSKTIDCSQYYKRLETITPKTEALMITGNFFQNGKVIIDSVKRYNGETDTQIKGGNAKINIYDINSNVIREFDYNISFRLDIQPPPQEEVFLSESPFVITIPSYSNAAKVQIVWNGKITAEACIP